MKKYITTKVGSIITRIAKPTEIKGYTEGVLECFLPDENSMTDEDCDKWIIENNNRMRAICDFLNKSNL